MDMKSLRKTKLGLQTLFLNKPQGYFIPYRYADGDIPASERGHYAAIERVFHNKKARFLDFLDGFKGYSEHFSQFTQSTPPMPRWEQDWFPGLDGAAAYVMVHKEKPSNIIEIGSGHSTRFMHKAVEDSKISTKIQAIDPAPRADISKLFHVKLRNMTVQNVDRQIFSDLQAGDFLFIDSSHILMPGNDVDLLFNHIMPTLPAGVIIHIHDITLPDDYPEDWQWRGYNEQLGVIPLLTSGGYDVIWSSYFVNTRMHDLIPDWFKKYPNTDQKTMQSSLWLRKVCPAT